MTQPTTKSSITDLSELCSAITNSVAASGPSPNGLSYLGHSSRCYAAGQFARARVHTAKPIDFTILDKFIVGTMYHALKEISFTARIEVPLTAVDKTTMPGLYVALRCFHKTPWLGKVLGVEIPLSGVTDMTGRADAAIELSAEDCMAAMEYEAFNLIPGLWLWDHKTAAAIKKEGSPNLRLSLQGPLYCKMYERQFGRRPLGIIYDSVSKADKPTISRQLEVVLFDEQTEAALDAALIYHAANEGARVLLPILAEQIFNPLACTIGMTTCRFADKCPRVGNKETLAKAIATRATFYGDDDE